MAGYSGRSLPQKLGIKLGCSMAVIEPPANYLELLDPMPEGVRFCTKRENPDLFHYFCTKRERLARDLPRLRKLMRDDATLWVSWPKKSAGLPTTVTEDTVREIALPLGLVDNKVCAVDETWSALRLVVRLTHRATR
ncbi:MAG TPA: DUF3052 domain-containing protein [Chthoniobacterales bacterium]